MRAGVGIILFFLFFLTGCSNELTDDEIPYMAFSPIHIELAYPEFNGLNTLGYVYIDGGVRGILLYKNGSSYIAYERNCSYHPGDACATIEMHSSTLYIEDPCCGSTFTPSTGEPASGPAWRPLRQYATYLSGSELTITDEIVR